jgi:hypothetical protein
LDDSRPSPAQASDGQTRYLLRPNIPASRV